jgi:hypothetical protein
MKTMTITALALALFPVALGCGPAAVAQPHAMSATEHEAAASQEQQVAESHGQQYDPAASVTKKNCGPRNARSYTEGPCWTSDTNPTEEHGKDAEHHRELAAQHRAASETLRTAESRACSGIPEEDRDESPFAHREDIRSVAPLNEQVMSGRTVSTRLAGAQVVFSAVPGMTAEWLQRIVDCHLARNAAIGHDMSGTEMTYCPLTLRGAQAKVRSVGDGFAVEIRADDAETSKGILQRAESLRPSAVATK